MASPDVTAVQRSDLNAFLFADVGTEANGMTLSVVSVLARQGRDPWGEAGRLSELTKADATDSLARTIAGMPSSLWDLPAAGAIAVRLIGLLPPRPGRGPKLATARWPGTPIIAALVCIALLVAFAGVAMLQSGPPAQADGSDVASFSSAVPGDHSQVGKKQ